MPWIINRAHNARIPFRLGQQADGACSYEHGASNQRKLNDLVIELFWALPSDNSNASLDSCNSEVGYGHLCPGAAPIMDEQPPGASPVVVMDMEPDKMPDIEFVLQHGAVGCPGV